MARVTLLEVEPSADGPWDPDSEQELGDFNTREEAIAFILESITEEGWDEEEWKHWPPFGTQGSRFQFRDR